MKTKFSAIAKVRKQQLDNAELRLSEAKQRQREHQKLYELSYAQLRNLSLVPNSGLSNELKSNLAMANIGKEALQRAKEKVELSEKEIVHYQFLYQKANLEYEKIKTLEAKEIKEKQKELQKAEQKFIDELAITRFFRNKGEKKDD
ncbi:flagellar export protein FliJ [Campylobacter cuniculorum]|uniref:Flagellar FliJ protein n=2 Tax=Campylobacter cuniculorum TaxID=374106 RepID=A0A1W6BY95_9BACT|nr:flagellar export protein FliJ [Campylobacter cuniculorum]ARJ57022.1 putative flagellar protein FliJ [Campylobacter cuniculorum DSM 23162 = LMG 24588]QOR04472.1 flagellar FliJ family protein [Campylobacter cuniculorum]